MTRPLTQDDLIFPSQSLSISSTLSSLKRSALSIHNRLSSISSDSAFVSRVSEAYGLPLVANERCGSWYIPPEKKAESVYFKSTDGHTNEWSFSLRRLNLQLLELVGRIGGCVIVDSTRRGKSMPDALSKTVPIWCCVMNRTIFTDPDARELHTPPQAVSPSEHAQIESRIDGFVQQFLDVCKPDIPHLRSIIQKPLRPIWTTQGSPLPDPAPSFPTFHPVILCTASRRVHGSEASEGGYIQGAADDHEAWATSLTPSLFWAHAATLLTTSEDALPSLIASLSQASHPPNNPPILLHPTSTLHVASTQNIDLTPFTTIISCTPLPLTPPDPTLLKGKHYLHLRCPPGKPGSRALRTQIRLLVPFFATLARKPDAQLGAILVCCPSGKDLSVAVALAILCLYVDEEGGVSPVRREGRVDKVFVKQRLAWITTRNPGLNPPRGTLQSVNDFLMSGSLAGCDGAEDGVGVGTGAGTGAETMGDGTGPATGTGTGTEDGALKDGEDTIGGDDASPSHAALFTTLRTVATPWTFTRTLTSKLPTHPSGTVVGTATFAPHVLPVPSSSSPSSSPSSSSSSSPPSTAQNQDSHSPLLYSETGTFTTTTALVFTASRKYLYRLTPDPSAPDPRLSVHFWEEERGKTGRDAGLFVEMGLLEASRGSTPSSTSSLSKGALGLGEAMRQEDGVGGPEGHEGGVYCARNKDRHLCAADLYTASWRVSRGMLGRGGDMWWEVRYDVKGPKKDYVSVTRYERGV